jgi:hypothetical protein
MLSDTDAACLAIALAMCLEKKKQSLLDQSMVRTYEDRNTRVKAVRET